MSINDKPEEKFVSYTRFKQEQSKSNERFMVVENVSELEDHEKKLLNTIVHEIFAKSESELKANKIIPDDKLEQLFFKDTAAIKFLLDSQSSIISTEFIVNLHPSKFSFMSKILKIIIVSKVNRHYQNRLYESF